IVTINTNGKNYKNGVESKEIGLFEEYSILIADGVISQIIPNSKLSEIKYDKKIDLTDKIIMPGLVECHTHTVFAGSRAKEFNMRLNGKSYEEIAMAGGGINSTVKSVRESGFEELVNISKPRIENFIRQGVTTLEIKSGYGLSFYDEIKLLEVVNKLDSLYPIDIIPTFLGAHTFPPEYINDKEKYIDIIINEMLPYISEKKLAKSCDGFCELTAFSTKQIEKIFIAAADSNLNLKLHTDQFNSIGGLELALEMGAKSVDHLEVLSDVDKVANSETVAVLLPGVSFSLQYNYAPARKLLDNNAIVALSTDYNPGSSHINNISNIWGLAAFKMSMKMEEIITAYTINSAKALGISEAVGSIEVGKSADFSIYNAKEYSELLYNFGNNLNVTTIKSGKVAQKSAPILQVRDETNYTANRDKDTIPNNNCSKPKVLTGVNVLENRNFDILENKRVGLITNQTGVNNILISTIDILNNSPNVNLVALFGPEHGVRGDVEGGEYIKFYTDTTTNLPVYSLYGKTRKPNADMLKNIDVLVYDIQDIGVRSYTFISTMGLAMEAASENGIEFVVLDRPNPLGGIKIEGNIVEEDYISFIGQFPIPYVYGLTCGELAKLIVGENFIKTKPNFKLNIVSMENWERKMDWEETGLNWIPTSPHIPHSFSPYFYPMTGILGELRNLISIGVGYTLPFQIIGAEWINSKKLTDKLNSFNLPGISFIPITFKPYYAFGKGKYLSGSQIIISDFNLTNLTEVQFYILFALKELYPDKNLFNLSSKNEIGMFNKAIGTDKIVKYYNDNLSISEVVKFLNKDLSKFKEVSEKYYLYY
ncbi:unnamed protein product, partial [Cyprideis torosa]